MIVRYHDILVEGTIILETATEIRLAFLKGVSVIENLVLTHMTKVENHLQCKRAERTAENMSACLLNIQPADYETVQLRLLHHLQSLL